MHCTPATPLRIGKKLPQTRGQWYALLFAGTDKTQQDNLKVHNVLAMRSHVARVAVITIK
jgi:hypothetical protein